MKQTTAEKAAAFQRLCAKHGVYLTPEETTAVMTLRENRARAGRLKTKGEGCWHYDYRQFCTQCDPGFE